MRKFGARATSLDVFMLRLHGTGAPFRACARRAACGAILGLLDDRRALALSSQRQAGGEARVHTPRHVGRLASLMKPDMTSVRNG